MKSNKRRMCALVKNNVQQTLPISSTPTIDEQENKEKKNENENDRRKMKCQLR